MTFSEWWKTHRPVFKAYKASKKEMASRAWYASRGEYIKDIAKERKERNGTK